VLPTNCYHVYHASRPIRHHATELVSYEYVYGRHPDISLETISGRLTRTERCSAGQKRRRTAVAVTATIIRHPSLRVVVAAAVALVTIEALVAVDVAVL